MAESAAAENSLVLAFVAALQQGVEDLQVAAETVLAVGSELAIEMVARPEAEAACRIALVAQREHIGLGVAFAVVGIVAADMDNIEHTVVGGHSQDAADSTVGTIVRR